ncbi:hypothetical protein [Paenibacillus sp. 1P07SE]|uniref:hypothetical protein n=1 Tax=Paenibacillus sp. 1P07SE TaxID=3132209 RepID=UPI0039A65033
MEVVWIIVAAVIVIGLIVLGVRSSKRWIPIRSEGASRVHQIDRLKEYLKTQGIKSKVASGAAGTVQLKVLKTEEDKARSLMESFDNEQ